MQNLIKRSLMSKIRFNLLEGNWVISFFAEGCCSEMQSKE